MARKRRSSIQVTGVMSRTHTLTQGSRRNWSGPNDRTLTHSCFRVNSQLCRTEFVNARASWNVHAATGADGAVGRPLGGALELQRSLRLADDGGAHVVSGGSGFSLFSAPSGRHVSIERVRRRRGNVRILPDPPPLSRLGKKAILRMLAANKRKGNPFRKRPAKSPGEEGSGRVGISRTDLECSSGGQTDTPHRRRRRPTSRAMKRIFP